MAANDQILAALQDLKTDLDKTLTDLEQAVQDGAQSGDPAPALALIATMKTALAAADATVVPPAP